EGAEFGCAGGGFRLTLGHADDFNGSGREHLTVSQIRANPPRHVKNPVLPDQPGSSGSSTSGRLTSRDKTITLRVRTTYGSATIRPSSSSKATRASCHADPDVS